MSAYVVSENLLSYLVSAALSRKICPHGIGWPGKICAENKVYCTDAKRGEAIGQMLLEENYKSVNYRYSEKGEAYPFKLGRELSVEPVKVLRAIDTYVYQACEHPGFYESEAYAFCEALRARAIKALPGYDDAIVV